MAGVFLAIMVAEADLISHAVQALKELFARLTVKQEKVVRLM